MIIILIILSTYTCAGESKYTYLLCIFSIITSTASAIFCGFQCAVQRSNGQFHSCDYVLLLLLQQGLFCVHSYQLPTTPLKVRLKMTEVEPKRTCSPRMLSEGRSPSPMRAIPPNPNGIPTLLHLFAIYSTRPSLRSSNIKVNPIEICRSFNPIKSSSTPGTAKILSRRDIAAAVSIMMQILARSSTIFTYCSTSC